MRVYAEQRRTETAAMPSTTTATEAAAGRVLSIEMEPKTLTFDQIKYAREAALYVMSTKTEEEAIRIFTAGLKPVHMTAAAPKLLSPVDSSDDDVDLDGSIITGRKRGRSGRQPSSSMDIRDVATAPF